MLTDIQFKAETNLEAENDALKAQISNLEAKLKLATETWSWHKWFVGLSRNGAITSLLGTLITISVGYLTSKVPELAPYKDELMAVLFTLVGITVAGQNVANINKK